MTPTALAILISLASAPPANIDPNTLDTVRQVEAGCVAMIEQASRAVVCIFDADMAGGGSGVIFSADGYGLTNFHVIAAMLEKGNGFGGLSDGQLYPLEVLGADPTGDVAMFRLSGKDAFEYAPLGNSDQLRVGDPVYAIGNPFMLAEDYTPTVTAGIISGLNRYQYGADQRNLVYTDCIQVDASVNPGNSGGPLFDAAGRVIGINGRASFKQRGRVNVGLAYAISINQIKRFMAGMRAGLLVEHGTLGATVIGDDGHVVFNQMLQPSAASEAGIRTGDRLVELAGRKIHSANMFLNVIGTYPAGWPIEVVTRRGDEERRQTITLDRLAVDFEGDMQRDESVTARAAAGMQSASSNTVEPGALAPVFDKAVRATVKLYGAASRPGMGYGSGVIVSGDGLVVTTLTVMLEGTTLRAVTRDGDVYPAEVIHRDLDRQLAVLQLKHDEVSASDPPFESLEPVDAANLQTGDWVLAAGNPFKVAEGREPVSISMGVVSGRTRLDAVRGFRPFPYRGDVILIDAITSNDGADGGALIDLEGRWVGLIGRRVTCRRTNTNLNFAYPVDVVQAVLAEAGGRDDQPTVSEEPAGPGYHGIRLSRIGYRKRLPFVERVAAGSPAEQAGVQPDDLIISANGTSIKGAREFDDLCSRLEPGDHLALVLKRGEEFVSLELTLAEEPE